LLKKGDSNLVSDSGNLVAGLMNSEQGIANIEVRSRSWRSRSEEQGSGMGIWNSEALNLE